MTLPAMIDPGITLGVENASRWARRVAIVLGVNAVVSGVGLVMSVVQTVVFRNGVEGVSDAFMEQNEKAFGWLGNAGIAALLFGAIVFIKWTSAVFTVAPRLIPPESRELRDFPASRVATSFFIPLSNLVRPYYAFSALAEALDPADLMVPRLRPNPRDAAGGYRDAAVEPIPERIPVPRPPVRMWWAAWVTRMPIAWIAGVFERENPLGGVLAKSLILCALDLAAALLAIRVVGRIDARLRERHRRLAFADVEP